MFEVQLCLQMRCFTAIKFNRILDNVVGFTLGLPAASLKRAGTSCCKMLDIA